MENWKSDPDYSNEWFSAQQFDNNENRPPQCHQHKIRPHNSFSATSSLFTGVGRHLELPRIFPGLMRNSSISVWSLNKLMTLGQCELFRWNTMYSSVSNLQNFVFPGFRVAVIHSFENSLGRYYALEPSWVSVAISTALSGEMNNFCILSLPRKITVFVSCFSHSKNPLSGRHRTQ